MLCLKLQKYDHSFVIHSYFLSFYFIFPSASLCCLHIEVCVYHRDLLFVSFRSWATIQADSPGIAQNDLARRRRSRSLCSRKRSSSSSRRNTLAGLSRRRNEAHPKRKDTAATVETPALRFVDHRFLDQIMLWKLVSLHVSTMERENFDVFMSGICPDVINTDMYCHTYREHVIYSVFPAKSFHSENPIA